MGSINRWCIMCGAAPGEPCTVISSGDLLEPGEVRPEVHFYRFNTEKPAMTVRDEPDFAEVLDLDPALMGERYPTNTYEEFVPENLADDVAAKYDRWLEEGRNSREIWGLVQSLVLEAYTWQHPPARVIKIDGRLGGKAVFVNTTPKEGCQKYCAGIVGGPGCDCAL